MTRRRFLFLLAASGIVSPPWEQHDASVAQAASGLASVTLAKRALGAGVSITACHAQRSRAEAAIVAAFDELETIEQAMSLYRPDSQLSRLNRDGRIDNPHPYLVEALSFAQDLSRITRGAFDLTVQPLWELRHRAQREQRRLTESELADARAKVGWERISVSAKRVAFGSSGMAATFNGIAQGLAADKAAAALRRSGIEHALIDAGELHPLGRNVAGKGSGDGWTAGIQHPRVEDAYVAIARLAGGRCLATSGDYATTFSDDFRHHHIFDPRTGQSPTELASVSVVAPTAMAADSLSTACMVLGVEQGAALLRQFEQVDALWVRKDGRILKTEGFPLER
jgi:thiamine biosynthesis lipoprotein